MPPPPRSTPFPPAAVRLRAAEANGLVPVVGDRTPLPQEVLQLLAELRLGRAARRHVGAERVCAVNAAATTFIAASPVRMCSRSIAR